MKGYKKLYNVLLAVVVLTLATLACSQPTDDDTPGIAAAGVPSVTINSPPSGTTVAVGEEVKVTSYATAGAGVARVELSISGLVVRSDAPPGGSPASFSVVQAWTPDKEGDVTISVVAYDTTGAVSEPAMIMLQVTAGGAGAMPTQTTPPGSAPTPTEVPAVPGGGDCKLNAAYVADVSIPDNTPLAPGTAFVKTWRIRNSSTCDWISGFDLVFVKGDRMGGETEAAVPATASGDTAEVSVHLAAPSTTGTYRGEWRMRSDEGTPFGSVLYVQIVVPGATKVPTQEPTKEPTKEPTQTPTVEPPSVLSAPFVPGMSGGVTEDGLVVMELVGPGDTIINLPVHGFITFDISSLPNDATVESAALTLGPCTPLGDGGLGPLIINNYQYGNLDASDFGKEGPFVGQYDSYCPAPTVDVTETVQARVGQSHYQLHLWFFATDHDDQLDGVVYIAPTLSINYK